MSKTAKEWLEHFPPNIRERVQEEREKYFKEEEGDWQHRHNTLHAMLYFSMPGRPGIQRRDPYWNDVYRRIEAGEFDKPWVESTTSKAVKPTIEEVKDNIKDLFPIGSKRLYVISEPVKIIEHGKHPSFESCAILIEFPDSNKKWLSLDELNQLKQY